MEAPQLTTERLVLRPFASGVVAELHALFTDAHVRRWLLDDDVVSRAWVEGEIADSEARFSQVGCGLWSVSERSGTPIIGFVGYRPFFDPPELQLLYGLLPAFCGRGFATEAATTAVDYAFDVLHFDEVRAATDTPNQASVAVLERLGMSERRRTAEGGHGTVFFSVTAAEWQERRSRPLPVGGPRR
ncbi:MAG: GNAT family N-acetyltransferase [Gemmatimonadetes bacterium]|nr:GNAT family N-acetyltransferase [Gemmatimonadota bacterium]